MKVLVVLREKQNEVSYFLRSQGFEVEEAANGRQGFARALSGRFTVSVVDPSIEGWGGRKGVSALSEARPLLRLVLIAENLERSEEMKKEYQGVVQVEEVLPASALPQALSSAFSFMKAAPSFRQTKIVSTVGPASSSEEKLRALLEAGTDVVRLNFSHADHKWHREVLKRIRTIAAGLGRQVAVLQDLCGPKIRVGPLEGGEVSLTSQEMVNLLGEERPGTSSGFSISLPSVLRDLSVGDRVLLDDGKLELKVEKEGESSVSCRVIHGGVLEEGKGVNLPGAALHLPGLTAKDREDLFFGIEEGVDYVAVSFVRSPSHVEETKELIASKGSDIPVIAKIEKPEAVASLDAIVSASDGVMIARGDLGVELAATRVPRIQQRIIKCARRWEKPVITATQMLDSMTSNPRPTRAEVADVTKAVEEGTDAVMLSGETAVGRYPALAVQTMADIVAETEVRAHELPNPFLGEVEGKGLVPALSQGLALISDKIDLALVAAATRSGRTVLSISKTHPDSPILAISDVPASLRRVCLYHGVFPAQVDTLGGEEDIFYAAEKAARHLNMARKGDIIAVLWDPEWKGASAHSLVVRFGRVGSKG